ncbi:MAG: nuclear transport factor 2 family protein [Sulfuricella denitrificans]|nr:nuclear transport factor 2 family protein [Sulfuricella denitrificans]
MFISRSIRTLALLSLSGVAFAGPAEDATSHFMAIGAGNIEQIMSQYADNATFQWLGGPLDGTYSGADRIREVWGKFTKNGPFEVAVAKSEESANDKGATVTANVEFKGKNTIKVRYVLAYRGGKLVNEIWQIDPKLAMSASY